MNRLLAIVPVLIAVLSMSAIAQDPQSADAPQPINVAQDSGTDWATVVETGEGTLRVLYVPAEGFAYEDDAGHLTGVTIEIARDFAAWVEEETGAALRVDFVSEDDWRTFYNRVRDGRGGLLGLGNVTITESRRDELHFSPPYLTNVAVLITRSGMDELAEIERIGEVFAGLRPLAFEGTLHEDRLTDLRDRFHQEAQLDFASSNDEIIERTAGGGYYAYVDGYNFWRAEAQGVEVMRHAAGDDPAEEFGIIMPLDSDWHDVVQAFFDAGDGYRAGERYRELLRTHLGDEVAAVLLAAADNS